MESRNNDWDAIGEIALAIVDCEHKTAPTQEEGIPSIRTTDISNGRLDLRNANKVSEETYKLWTQRLEPRPLDLILAREAPVGEVGIVPPGQRVCLGQRTVLIRPDPSKVYPYFLMYLLLTPEMRHEVTAKAEGSVVPHLNMADIRRLRLPKLPPISVQRSAADVLRVLDNKIELNRQMNETLEGIARAIFKAWFVDFEPVFRPEAAGEYGHLFPRGLNEEGVPEGWRKGKLSEIIELIGGGTPKTSVSTYWDGEIPWYSVRDAPSESDVFVIKTEKSITQAGVDNSSAKVLPENTTIISARGTVGKLALAGVPMAMNQSCYGITGAAGFPDFFTFFYVRAMIEGLQQRTHGTVFATITRQTFSTVDVVIPPVELANGYEEQVTPLLNRLRHNLFEAMTLAELRDTLLPKLISGEVRVPVE